MTDNLGIELSKVLFAKEPALLACDAAATARASSAVADLLGCLLATVLKKSGEKGYEEAFKTMAYKIHESACKTAKFSERAIPDLYSH